MMKKEKCECRKCAEGGRAVPRLGGLCPALREVLDKEMRSACKLPPQGRGQGQADPEQRTPKARLGSQRESGDELLDPGVGSILGHVGLEQSVAEIRLKMPLAKPVLNVPGSWFWSQGTR